MINITGAYDLLIKLSAVFGLSTFALAVWCIKACIKFASDLKFISSAIKSQIRSDLMKDFEIYYNRDKKGGWCSTIEQTEWINRYNNYHNLYGENGVLDNKYKTIINMSNAPHN